MSLSVSLLTEIAIKLLKLICHEQLIGYILLAANVNMKTTIRCTMCRLNQQWTATN